MTPDRPTFAAGPSMGWPNVLSPHDCGPAIEDVWPTLFFGGDRLDELRRRVADLDWATAAFAQWRAEAETVLAGPPQLPIEPPGWRHDFFSPITAEHLLFDPRDGAAMVDPWDQSRHPMDGARRRAWVLLAHERTYRLLRSLGLLFALTGDGRYAAWVAAGLRDARAMFRREDFRRQHRQQALYFQPLYDAQVLLLIANAYDLTRASAAYTAGDHAGIAADIFASGIPHQLAFLDADRVPPNMLCYASAAVGIAGELLERPEWRDAALRHPRAGLFALLRDGLPADAGGELDGFWVEGSQFYHLYSVCPLIALFDLGRRERERGRLAEPDSGLSWADVERRLAALLQAPALLADAQLRLPCFGDLGAPKQLQLQLFRHLYEFAAGQLDAQAFGPLLVRLYAGGLPRNSLAAVAYGPDALPDVGPADRAPAAASSCLPAAGIAVLRAGGDMGGTANGSDLRLEVWLRAGPIRGGHDHADRLSLDLHAGGEVIAADLGTAGYGLQEFTRYCRSSFAHNTLLVDEQDQQRVRQAGLRFGSPADGDGGDGGWALGVLEDAYPGVRLERRVRLRAPYVLLEDRCASAEHHRYGWLLHVCGSLAVDAERQDAGLALPPLPADGPWAWFTNRHGGVTGGPLRADWRIRDGLRLRLLVAVDGPCEWTAGQTPGNPIPDRRCTLLLRAPGRARRFRAMLEVHRGAPTLEHWDERLFAGEPFELPGAQ